MSSNKKPYESPKLSALVACKGEFNCIFRRMFSIPVPMCQRCDCMAELMAAHGGGRGGLSVAAHLTEQVDPQRNP